MANNEERLPVAFVLMKFEDEPWKDKTYQAISEVIEEAGYRPLRADEIPTSGPVVDEVCTHLESAPLVVIDTTGDSHSVSYELGYAHGVGRSHEETVILRSVANGKLPFNYAHFRTLMYRDRGHLKQRLRSWVNVTKPLLPGQLGYAFNFSIMPNAGAYGDCIAMAILEALERKRFSGRCEYYAGELRMGRDSFYIVGLAVKNEKGIVPDLDWWVALLDLVSKSPQERPAKVMLNSELSELCEVQSLRTQYLPRGVVEFEKGVPVFILGGGLDADTWFLVECRNRLAGTPEVVSKSQVTKSAG